MNRILHKSIQTYFQRKHAISTLGPLGSQFNQLPKSLNKKSFFKTASQSNIGLFGIQSLKTPNGFYSLKEEAKQEVERLINEALQSDDVSRRRKLVQIFDDISNKLCKVADLSEFIRTTHPNGKYREAADDAFSGISELVEQLNTNLELYRLLNDSYLNASNLDECDRRVTRLYLVDFEQSGIHLDKVKRDQYVQVNNDLIELLMEFQRFTQVPATVYSKNVEKKFTKILKNQGSSMSIDAMYSNSDDELFREFIYKSYLQDNPEQSGYFDMILNKRRSLIVQNFTSIMETPENVVNFLDLLAESIRTKADRDFDVLRTFKGLAGTSKPVMQWDVPYLTKKYKKFKLDLDATHYKEYLSLGSCMEGLNIIVNHLYNINLEVEQTDDGEVWSDDVYKICVKHANEGVLGYIYCDFYQSLQSYMCRWLCAVCHHFDRQNPSIFERADKFSNVDCHYTIQCSKEMPDGTYQLPIVVLHLNLIKSKTDKPTLLSFEMMENLFHEFGHAMHSMLAKTRYQHVSGTRCSTDFAEVPSQLMEYFCREPKVLKLFAKHYSTGEPLSDDIIYKLCESKKLFVASDLQLQILHSMLDQRFHSVYPLNGTPLDLIKTCTTAYYSLPYVHNTHWHLRFSHFVGYGAKYYSYLVSKAIAAQIWNTVFASDPLSSTAGDNYRRKLLAYGGERKPGELVKSLTGFNIDNKSLVHSLVDSL